MFLEPSNSPAEDVAAAAAAVEAARKATYGARERVRRALTEDQRLVRAQGMRRQLANLSKRTPSSSPVSPPALSPGERLQAQL